MKRLITDVFLLACLAAILVPRAVSQEYRLLVDLRGQWKFELGDDLKRAEADFNDQSWAVIDAPGSWEDQGYPGYDGFAWYRKHFRVSGDLQDKVLYVRLGAIDDADEVYVNGHFIGFTGSMPPNYSTAYAMERVYFLPTWCVNTGGDNVIAVRVYDAELAGGIQHGSLGLYDNADALKADFSLDGAWKLQVGDNPAWKFPNTVEHAWADAYVPAFWETQGHRDYDGIGWYRVRFNVPPALAGKQLILLLGKIDDFDETYLNGEAIGHTGPHVSQEDVTSAPTNGEYQQLRAYTVPPGILHTDQENVLAVRVADVLLHGGIYQGPVGLITRERYKRWASVSHDNRPWPVRLLEALFH